MKRLHLIVPAALVIIAALVLTGCNSSDRTKISSILNHSDAYMNREVIVAGEVSRTYEVNLVIAEAGAYQVDDGTGKIWVITKNGVPREGRKVGVKGIVSSGIKLGGETFGAIIKEQDRRTR